MRRRGTALVEMAIICPLVLLMAFATTDFGRVVYAYMSVSNAARVGAEYAALHGFTAYSQASWESQLRQVVDNEMQGLSGYQSANLQVVINATTDAAGVSLVSVEVRYPFSTIVNWIGVPSEVLLDHAVEMRRRQ
jgi:Flp pilus assembly protein TadG